MREGNEPSAEHTRRMYLHCYERYHGGGEDKVGAEGKALIQVMERWRLIIEGDWSVLEAQTLQCSISTIDNHVRAGHVRVIWRAQEQNSLSNICRFTNSAKGMHSIDASGCHLVG